MPPAIAGTPRNSLSNVLITTRTFGNSALRSELAMLRKYLISTEPGRTEALASACAGAWGRSRRPASARRTARRRRRPRARPSCVARGRTSAGSRSVSWCWPRRKKRPRGSRSSGASISTRTIDALAVRALDLLMRHLDEVGALEHGVSELDQLRIGAIDASRVEARVRIELRIEIVIGVPQFLEPVEIFVVIDRRQHPADLTGTVRAASRPRTRHARPARRGCRSCGPG